MRAFVVPGPGQQAKIEQISAPKPADDEILVRVVAAGVNPVDWKSIERKERPFPAIVGQDFAGVVEAAGDDVEGFKPGDRVFGISREHGAFAEFTLVPQDDRRQPIAHMPEGLSFADAAALPTAGLTALAALDVLRVGAGARVLILGLTGGVGSLAAQLAQYRGAQVTGTAHSEKHRLVEQLGTVKTIPYDLVDLVEAARSETPEGYDAVLDLVDDRPNSGKLATIIKGGGAIVSTIGGVDEELFAHHSIAATNIVMDETATSSPRGLAELGRFVVGGLLRVPLTQEPALEKAADALDASRHGNTTGKTVLMVGSA